MYKRQFIPLCRTQEIIAHGKNAINLATATKGQVTEQATVTSRIIKERVRRDNLNVMEQLHRAESCGSRNEQLEREQNEQESESDRDPMEELEDYLASSEDIPQSVIEPAIELTIDSVLEDIGGDDEVSLSLLEKSPLFKDLDGDNEAYPT